MADTLADFLRTLITSLGTKVPSPPMAPGTAGPPAPATTSYLPALETGVSSLAGLLQPQGGRRTWAGAVGNALSGGLKGYNAGENQLTEQQRTATEAALNQQKLASGGLELKSNQNLMNQYGSINPEAIKLQQSKAEAASFAATALQIANDPKTNPTDKAFWMRAASFANGPGGMDTVQKFTGIEKDRLAGLAEQTKADLAPLQKQELQAKITHEGASTEHERASTAHLNRMAGGGGGRAGAPEKTTTMLAEASREYNRDPNVVDPATGLPRDDAPSFDDWLVTEWPKRRGEISASGSAAPASARGSSDRSRPSGSLKNLPTGSRVPVRGMGDATLVGHEGGYAIVRFPDGRQFRVKE